MLLRLKRQMNLCTWTTTTTAAGLPTLELSPLRKRSTSLVVKNKEFEKLASCLFRNRKSVVELPELAPAKSPSPLCAKSSFKRLTRPHSSMSGGEIQPEERLVRPVKKFSCTETPRLVPRPHVQTLRSGPTSPLALYSHDMDVSQSSPLTDVRSNGVATLKKHAGAAEYTNGRSRNTSGNEAARRVITTDTKDRSVASSHSSLCPPQSPYGGLCSPTRSPSSLSTESLSPKNPERALSVNSSHGYTSHNTSVSCSPLMLGAPEAIADDQNNDAFAFDDMPEKVITVQYITRQVHWRRGTFALGRSSHRHTRAAIFCSAKAIPSRAEPSASGVRV